MALAPSLDCTDAETAELTLTQSQLLELLNFIWTTIHNLNNLMKSWEFTQTTEL